MLKQSCARANSGPAAPGTPSSQQLKSALAPASPAPGAPQEQTAAKGNSGRTGNARWCSGNSFRPVPAAASGGGACPLWDGSRRRQGAADWRFLTISFCPKKARLRHRLIGQLFETYWLVEYDKKLYIIDQHAAHEKVMYEKLKKHYENSTAVSQRLDPPMILSLTMHEEEALNGIWTSLRPWALRSILLGGREYAVRSGAFGTLRLYGKRSVY